MREYILQNSPESFKEITQNLWKDFERKLILFKGELGAGKTTLIKSLVSYKSDNVLASSPSFSIINEYPAIDGKIFHMDLYRLNDVEEAINIGIEDYLHSDNWIFIEWPQIIAPLLDMPYHLIEIEILDNSSRKIIFN